jgi:hypothetical protein
MDEMYLDPGRAQTQLILFGRKKSDESVMGGYNHPLQ